MAKGKLITIAQLKKSLQEYPQHELIALIADVSQTCPKAREYLTGNF